LIGHPRRNPRSVFDKRKRTWRNYDKNYRDCRRAVLEVTSVSNQNSNNGDTSGASFKV
jgi:hypothetical protein